MDRSQWAPTPLTCTFLSEAEYREREDARRAAVSEWQRANNYEAGRWPDELRSLSQSFLPAGSMWLCPWYYDPAKPVDEDGDTLEQCIAKASAPDYNGFLSVHYYRDWAKVRAPIVVVCPDFVHWIVDSKSSNGAGWVVTGEAPRLTCAPSIWTSMSSPTSYHGFLQNGVFTDPV